MQILIKNIRQKINIYIIILLKLNNQNGVFFSLLICSNVKQRFIRRLKDV
jgi:hypothetical protein